MCCPHCKKTSGHFSNIEYRCIDNKLKRQSYWFCHSCARLVYDDEKAFAQAEVQGGVAASPAV